MTPSLGGQNPSMLRGVLASAVALAAFLPAASDAQSVRWRSGPELRSASTRGEVAAVASAVFTGGDGMHVVVELERAASRTVRAQLAEDGVTLLKPLGGGAYFASLSAARFDVDGAMGAGGMRGIAPIAPEWKLHPELAAGRTVEWSVVEPGEDPMVAAYVIAHADVNPTRVAEIVVSRGGRVMSVVQSINGLVVEMPRSELSALATQDAVQWIEPPLPRFSDVAIPNDSNRVVTQVDDVQAAPYGLDGSGVTVMVYDGGTARSSHVDFAGRLTTRDGSSLSDHATHVSGTIGSNGDASGGTHQGMAPGVQIESYGFEFDGTSIFLYANPGDFEADYSQAINTFGADVSNNSIGTNTDPNGFNCSFQGDYGVMSSLIDAVVGGSLGGSIRVVWANGNERQGDRCDIEGFGDYYSTAPPSTAKNHITVGALNSNDDSMTGFSSWGPTDDGRMKPDVSAPGCQSDGDFGVTSTGSADDFALTVKCGTSMASPTTAGIVALLLEDWRAQIGGSDPSNAMVKVLLAHAAQDRFNVGPDNQYGYGSVRVKDTIDFMRLEQHDENTVQDQDGAVVYTMNVPGGAGEVKVTMAWDDAPGTPNVFGALVNDLDLVVIDPNGTRHFPWTLDPANPDAPAVRNAPNRRDNIEQVLVNAPVAGTWRVEVRGHSVAVGPQTFAIAGSHDITAGPYVDIGFPVGLPASVEPGATTTVRARIEGVGEGIVASTATLNVRLSGGAFFAIPMSSVGGDEFEADVPAAICSEQPEFFVSAEGTSSGLTTNPFNAPTNLFSFDVEASVTLVSEDFEATNGWTTENVSLDDGAWERGVPAGVGDRGDPLVDFDGSGACWLTDNVEGNSDVDGGPTRLISPSFDLSGTTGIVEINYAVWFTNNDFDADNMTVEVSGNGGGSWTLVESFGNTSGWQQHSFRPADFGALTSSTRVRFSASDNPNDSVTEAALDAFEIVEITCSGGAGAWDDRGCALAGVAGAPLLVGTGPLTAGSNNSLALSSAASNALSVLFVSLAENPVPFKGGTLKTVPILTSFSLTTSPAGTVALPFTFPVAPSGFTFYVQAAIADGAAPAGTALSNAVRGTAP